MPYSDQPHSDLTFLESSTVDLDYIEQICDIYRGPAHFCSIYRDPGCMNDYYVEVPIRRHSFLYRFHAALTLQQMLCQLLLNHFSPQQVPQRLRNALDSTFDTLYEQHAAHFAIHM
jgi:hypothetical protein